MVFTKARWPMLHSMGVSYDRTYSKYRDILDASYHRLLSESTNLEKLIQFAPGFPVLRQFMTIPNVAKLLEVDETSFLELLRGARHFVNFLHPSDITSSEVEVRLNDHVCEFLCDRNRSLGHYHNPRSHHFAICLKLYNLIFLFIFALRSQVQ